MILTQCSLSCGRTADLFLVFCWFSILFCALPKKIYVFRTRGNAFWPARLHMRNTFDRGVLHSISRLPITLCFTFVFAGFCCKMYSWNSSTFLFSLLSFSFTLSVCIPRFLVPSQQRNHRKSFGKENCCTSAKFYCGKTGNPERAISLHLAQYLNTYILLDALLRIVAEYFCALCHILTSL